MFDLCGISAEVIRQRYFFAQTTRPALLWEYVFSVAFRHFLIHEKRAVSN